MKRVLTVSAAAALSLLCAALLLIPPSAAGFLNDQNAAERWESGDRRYVQFSAFFEKGKGPDKNNIAALPASVNAALAAEFIEGAENARLWNFAYSTENRVTVTKGGVSVQARAVFTGGDFFFFHPLEMLSGSGYAPEDINGDAVVLDRQLAWKLFGGVDLTGKEIRVGSVRCIVSGVSEIPDSGAYGEESVIYLPYSLLDKPGAGENITCFEAVLPEPVKGFGEKIFTSALSSYAESCSVVKNTGRFSLPRLYSVLKETRGRAWRGDAVVFPFWENEARANEGIAALLLVPAAAAAVFPTALILFYLIKSYMFVRSRIINIIKARRAH